MKVTGIIAEYNPFHNGHRYHLDHARELTGADYTVVIMSGDYTQRGTPAIFTKYVRAETALRLGADLVLETPVFGALSPAPDFAACGVSGLSAAGICDFLAFGSESGNLDLLRNQAELSDTETEQQSAKIREGLKSGLTWPAARSRAFSGSGDTGCSFASSPNDILAVEYLRALSKCNSTMEPVTFRRTDPGYHSEERSGSYASATAARKAILEQNLDFFTEVVPGELLECLNAECCPPVTFDDFSMLLSARILNASLEDLEQTAGMPKDLAGKLFREKLDFHSAGELTTARKDRQYTYTRVSRCLLNFMLGITKEEENIFKEYHSVPWLRVLGFRKDAGPLLSELKRKTSAPVITRTADARFLLSERSYALFEKHLMAAELYRLVCELKTGRSMRNEYTRQILII